MKVKPSRTFVGIFMILLLFTTPLLVLSHQAHAASTTGVMVALYTYPDSTWDTVAQAKSAHPSVPVVAIINPNNGPGSSQDSNYVAGIQKLHAAGVVVLGYDATGYASNSLNSVKSVMNTWKSLYTIDGIFFDEMSNVAGNENYYSNLSSYAKSLGYTMTVGNPGTETLPSYIGTVDNLMIYEDAGLPALSVLQGWHTSYDKSNFSMIAFGISSLSQSFITSASNYVGYMYITNDNLPNPYDTIPLYFANEVADLDTGSIITAPGSPTGLTATTSSSSQINLSWSVPTNNGGSAITGYEIERSSNSGSTWSTIVANTASTTTTYSNTGLASGTTYTYRVSAINSVGTSSPSNTASAITLIGTTSNAVVLNGVQKTSGTVSSSPYQITLSNFNVGTGSNRVLVVGVEANNNVVSSITFGGIQLTRATHSFFNNDAEFWYLTNPAGTANIVVTMGGSTSVIVGAYSFFGASQTNPIPTSITNHNTASSSPTISLTTQYPNSWVLDLPSIYGGVTLGSPTCTQEWYDNIPSAITGASSSTIKPSAGLVTCSWTASGSGDLWDDTAIEIQASSTTSSSTAPGSPTGLTATTSSSSQINLSWSVPTNNGGSAITGYEIERSSNSGSTWSTIAANTASTTTTYSNTGLASGTTYTYRVSAINSVGTSSPSNTAFATTSSSTTSLTVKSVGLTGNTITGLWTTLISGGKTIQTGYTTKTFTVTTGNQYTVTVSNYQNYVFDHWSDGSTNPNKTITPTQAATLTAYYQQ